jgi:NAD(P)-dependent dehydrogenase (short-subunit alcohol dehydrogenase family)
VRSVCLSFGGRQHLGASLMLCFLLPSSSCSCACACAAAATTTLTPPPPLKVVNISATLHHGATFWQIHASAAKAAVDSMTRSWALEWGNYHIRVNGVAPGPIADTPGTAKLAPTTTTTTAAAAKGGGGDANKDRAKDEPTQVRDGWVKERIPLQRMGTAQEIGHAVVYLCTAPYVTGATLVVDGGERLYKPPLISRTQVAELSRKVEAASRAQRPRTSGGAAAAPSSSAAPSAAPLPALQSML